MNEPKVVYPAGPRAGKAGAGRASQKGKCWAMQLRAVQFFSEEILGLRGKVSPNAPMTGGGTFVIEDEMNAPD